MLKRLASAFSTPVATPPRVKSPELEQVSKAAVEPNSHAGRIKTERDLAETLREQGVPTSEEDCFTCDVKCEDGEEHEPKYEGYPRGFDVDWDTDLLGSANPAPRNLVISTARSDWEHDHTTDTSTLSYHLQTLLNAERGFPPPGTPMDPAPAKDQGKGDKGTKEGKGSKDPPAATVEDQPKKTPGQVEVVLGKNGLPQGISETPSSDLRPAPSEEPIKQPPTSLFSSSLISQSTDHEQESVMIFPEWKIICEVPNSNAGAKAVLNGLVGQQTQLKSWTLPYRAVVLLCSHKKRDKRCHIAAPLLEKALLHELESHHIHVDTRGDSLNPHHLEDTYPALPESGSSEEAERERESRLRKIEGLGDAEGNGEVGIFKISHLGGHRYSGVMIILFPSGATLYYGRVSPNDIPAVVNQTILNGKIVAGLLRGGNNIVRDELRKDSTQVSDKTCNKKGKTLLDW